MAKVCELGHGGEGEVTEIVRVTLEDKNAGKTFRDFYLKDNGLFADGCFFLNMFFLCDG